MQDLTTSLTTIASHNAFRRASTPMTDKGIKAQWAVGRGGLVRQTFGFDGRDAAMDMHSFLMAQV